METKWRRTDHVAIAVSGGVDSMVLLDKVRLTGRYKTLTILHIHHGLRAQSDEEAEMIQTYAEKHQLKFLMHRIPADYFNPHHSIQNAARDYRYQFFDEMIRRHNIDCLLTAHHRDDQNETILFRLLTGRFFTQPLGMAAETEDRGYTIYKPLLNESKIELYEYAEENKVPYKEDQSNRAADYTRNAIRLQLLPVIDNIDHLSADHLSELAEWQQEMLSLVEMQAYTIIEVFTSRGYYNRQEFSQLPKAVQRQVLIGLSQQEKKFISLSHHYLDEIIRVITSTTSQADYVLTEHLYFVIAYDKVYCMEQSKLVKTLDISLPGQYEFNGYMIELIEPITDIINVRVLQRGDRIKMNGHSQKLNRIMIDAKVPNALRSRMPVISVQNEIIAVGHLKRNQHPVNEKLIINYKGAE
ncbi:tRNA lysidine(34) synthetase TilS [Macrococcus hajekii]|uniref:tRNA(Ile)-lysidine synthase n=1 Tax=Macrococcus hajekii TaxID=198482 RepID=A0A4R6BHP0_9STAP|nr:tRNA lysidine(34) synthetase TilS [Macrococcus hajekii]TDM01031.1 tRNA lysidine(34) synthetase TilS [Macrococcus hajekii]GGB12923.1 tRNA(Ile)-lysidine synthase [Macrococcus hajekii]